jgi:hypothetical protein
MSQMPAKIWLHKDTKYSTADTVCGYQYDFVQGIEDEGGIENFVKYVPADTFIEKACEWLKFNYAEFTDNTRLGIKIDELIKDFKQAMEDKK